MAGFYDTASFMLDEDMLEAELGQDAIEEIKLVAIEEEERDTLYSPNRFVEACVTLLPHVWDEMMRLWDEEPDNLAAA